MVVDDDPGIHLMARTTLEADGCEVIAATDGEAALEALRNAPVDLILLDLRMPLLDGLETLRHLRQIGNETPVIIVTAYGTVPDAVEAMKLGAIDLLSKPLTPEELRRVVSDVVERHAARVREPGPRPAEGRTGPAAAVAQGRPAVDLTAVKVAMDRRDFDLATALLDRVIDTHPDAAEALAGDGPAARTPGPGPCSLLRVPAGAAWLWTPTTSTRRPACDATAPGSASMPTTPGSTRLPGDDLGSRHPHPGDGPMDTTPLTSSAAQRAGRDRPRSEDRAYPGTLGVVKYLGRSDDARRGRVLNEKGLTGNHASGSFFFANRTTGRPVNLFCLASGTGKPRFQWG